MAQGGPSTYGRFRVENCRSGYARLAPEAAVRLGFLNTVQTERFKDILEFEVLLMNLLPAA